MLFDELPVILDCPSLKKAGVVHSLPIRGVFAIVKIPMLPTLLSLLLLWGPLSAAERFDLTASATAGSLQQVQVMVELRGELKLNADGQKVRRLPLKVRAELLYDEKQLASSPPKRQAMRYYRSANADIRLNKGHFRPKLKDDQRLILASYDGETVALSSPIRPLGKDDLDLLQVQGSSLMLHELLPGESVALEQTWSLPQSAMAPLFGLDAVHQAETRATLRQVEGHVALVDAQGTISGGIGGVVSEIEFKAKYNFNLQQKQITWLAISFQEKRAIGHAEPGFDVTARLRMAVRPLADSPELADEALADLPRPAVSNVVELHSREGGFRLLHEDRWAVMRDRHDVTILRMIDQGDLIAQCNISNLPALPEGKQLPLEGFGQEIRHALDKHFGQLVEATQTRNAQGLRVMRVVASGVVDELPIQWIYYHVSSEAGRRAAFVFTLEAELVERFAENDQTLIETFQFVERPEPKPAEPPEAAASAARSSQSQRQ